MNFYKAVFTEGHFEARCSMSRAYSHCVVARRNGSVRTASWVGDASKIEARKAELRRAGNGGWDIEVAEAVPIDAREYRQLKRDARP